MLSMRIGNLFFEVESDLQRSFVHDNFMKAGFDEPAAKVLQLLASLNKQVASRSRCRRFRKANCNAFARITCPNVETRITGAAVNSEEVQVTVEAGEDGVFVSVFPEIGCGGSKKMGPDNQDLAKFLRP